MAAPAVLAAASIGIAAAVDDGSDASWCVFRRCTGGYCPGCGGGRAAWALLRGDPATAWAVHPWIPLLAVQFLLVGLSFRFAPARVRRALLPLLVVNTILGIGIWLMRLAAGSIPPPFT